MSSGHFFVNFHFFVFALVVLTNVHIGFSSSIYIDASENSEFCQKDSACGTNSVCYQGKCRCNLGFEWNSYMYSCIQYVGCLFDSQCNQKFPHSKCDSFSRTCIACKSNYEADSTSQICVLRSSSPSNWNALIILPIGIIILLLIFGGCFSGRWYYVRYMQSAPTVITVVRDQNQLGTPMTHCEMYPSYPQQPPPPPYNLIEQQNDLFYQKLN